MPPPPPPPPLCFSRFFSGRQESAKLRHLLNYGRRPHPLPFLYPIQVGALVSNIVYAIQGKKGGGGEVRKS